MNYAKHFEELKKIYEIPETSGFVETYLKGVRFFWSTEHVERAPLPHCRGIIIIGQGHKIGHLNGRTFRYDENNYLLASVPTSYECETFASPEKPVLGILVEIDVARLNAIIQKVDKYHVQSEVKKDESFKGVEPVKMTTAMQLATEKLLICLKDHMDSEVLGKALIDEIFYRALLGEHGQALVSLTQQDSRHARIANSLNFIHENYMQRILVDDLADKANMSVSSYHRVFKDVTGESPLQYLKKVRLNQARFLMMQDGLKVNMAAEKVGYDSVSQFSREFKRYFHVSPSAAGTANYASMYQ